MDDLVKRLREYGKTMREDEAADLIERLQAENAKLKRLWFSDADPRETIFKDEFLAHSHIDFPKEPDK